MRGRFHCRAFAKCYPKVCKRVSISLNFVWSGLDHFHRAYFNHIYTFTQGNFQPSLSFPFFNRLVLDAFVYERKSVKYVLQDSQGLGAHTSVMEFTQQQVMPAKGMRKPYTITGPTHFTWTHPGTAPAGKAISLQCSRCKCIGTMKRKKTSSDREILHKCSTDDCAMEIINTIPSGANWVFSKPPVKGDPSGAWLVEYNLAVDQL